VFYFISSEDGAKQELCLFEPFFRMNKKNPIYDYFKDISLSAIKFSLGSFRPSFKDEKFLTHFLIKFPLEKSGDFLNEIGLKINVIKKPSYRDGSILEGFLRGLRDTESLNNPFGSFVIAFKNIIFLKSVSENYLLLFGTENNKSIERSFLDLCNLTKSDYKIGNKSSFNDIKDLSCFGLRFLLYNSALGAAILFKENECIPFFTMSKKIKFFTPGFRLSYGKEFFGDIFLFANFKKFFSHFRFGIFNYEEIETLSILFGLGKSFGSFHIALHGLLARKKGFNLFLDFCLWVLNFRIGYKIQETISINNFSFSAVLY